MREAARASLFGLAIAIAGCGGQPAPETPEPRTVAAARRPLPPIPAASAPLQIDVVYPREDAAVNVRDSTFIFGNTGTGGATLRINGAAVPVNPNGSFLAYLPVPADGVYRLEASAEGRTTTAERRIKVPPATVASRTSNAPVIASLTPRGGRAVMTGEGVEVTFRGTSGGRATLILPDGRRVPLVEEARDERAEQPLAIQPAPAQGQPRSGTSTYRGFFSATPLVARDTSIGRPRLQSVDPDAGPMGPQESAAAAAAAGAEEQARAARRGAAPATASRSDAVVELIVGGDTARAPLPLTLAVINEFRPMVGVAADPRPLGGTNDGYVVGRPAPGATSHYFWPNGTEFEITGEREGEYRVRLGDGRTAWVSADEVRLLPAGTPPPRSMVNTVRMRPTADMVEVRFSLSRRIPYEVEVEDRAIVVKLFGGTGATDWLIYGSEDPLVKRGEWDQDEDGVYRFTLNLTRPVWGYRTSWTPTDDLLLEVRRPPPIDPQQPLRGLLVAVDPGHGPPEGRFGPTRYTESAANLAISLKLGELLQQAGARVLLTRTDSSAVGLYDRPRMAMEAGAHLFVSVHNNALPDGVNPFENNGISTFYFHPHSAALARAFQAELVNEFPLRDLGAGRSSLAVVRWPTWFPAALTESMFFMIPEQEAALKDPAVQERIARAHLRALERFVRNYSAGD